MRLIYLIPGWDSAIISQVISLLKYYEDTSIFEDILLLAPEYREITGFKRVKIKFFKVYPFINLKSIKLSVISLKKVLKTIFMDEILSSDIILHCRGDFAAYIVKKAFPKLRVIADFRGVSWAQYLFYHPRTLSYRLFHPYKLKTILSIEESAYISSDGVSAVSPYFKSYLELVWGKRGDFCVVPCLADQKYFYHSIKIREKTRMDLQIDDNDFLILFSTGGNSPWQKTEEIIKKFKSISRENIKLLILVNNPSKLEKYRDRNIIIKKALYGEVNSYLNASDAGLLFRDDNIVNHIASPIKFSEYICAGLPVILNTAVYSAADYVRNNSAGIIMDDLSMLDDEKIENLRQLNRGDISRRGIKYFGLNTCASRYIDLYKSLLN